MPKKVHFTGTSKLISPFSRSKHQYLRQMTHLHTMRPCSMSPTAAQWERPTHCLHKQEPHGCGDQVCQQRTACNHLCLPSCQYISTGKEFHSRQQSQAIRDDCHKEPGQCAAPSTEDALGVTEIQCDQVKIPCATHQHFHSNYKHIRGFELYR